MGRAQPGDEEHRRSRVATSCKHGTMVVPVPWAGSRHAAARGGTARRVARAPCRAPMLNVLRLSRRRDRRVETDHRRPEAEQPQHPGKRLPAQDANAGPCASVRLRPQQSNSRRRRRSLNIHGSASRSCLEQPTSTSTEQVHSCCGARNDWSRCAQSTGSIETMLPGPGPARLDYEFGIHGDLPSQRAALRQAPSTASRAPWLRFAVPM